MDVETEQTGLVPVAAVGASLGTLVFFEGQHITGSCRELSAGLPVSPAVGADGGVKQEERAEEQRGRRPEWHHHATSAGPTAGPPAGSPTCCLTAFSWVLTRSWKQEAYRKQTEHEGGARGVTQGIESGGGGNVVLCRKNPDLKTSLVYTELNRFAEQQNKLIEFTFFFRFLL